MPERYLPLPQLLQGEARRVRADPLSPQGAREEVVHGGLVGGPEEVPNLRIEQGHRAGGAPGRLEGPGTLRPGGLLPSRHRHHREAQQAGEGVAGVPQASPRAGPHRATARQSDYREEHARMGARLPGGAAARGVLPAADGLRSLPAGDTSALAAAQDEGVV